MNETNNTNKKKVISVLGPTASGKTAVAIEIAKKFNGVIINCDSRQIYQEMFIGTASPTPEEKAIVEHRLFNFVSPTTLYNASDYATAAANEIQKVWQEGKLPILTGGTGFYYSAISEGLGSAGSDETLATELQNELSQKGLDFMVSKLQSLDAEAVLTIDTKNSRRVLRAIEVVISTGKPFSQNKPEPLLPEAEFVPIVVSRPRENLHKRIELRIDQMFDMGLEKEVLYIIEKYSRQASALSSIGYREWLDYFDGKITMSQLRESILFHTRQYAKRQETWFRKKPGIPFKDLDDPESMKNILEEIRKFITHSS